MRRFQRRQEREPGLDEIGAESKVKPPTGGHDRPQPGKFDEVTVRNFKNREAPRSPNGDGTRSPLA